MQIHILSFEGPDHYARASGLATRMTGVAQALAKAGYETHLWFVGDPDLPGHETQEQLHLHRWCQWISRYHPAGVYDGEEGKRSDYAASLPPFLLQETGVAVQLVLKPSVWSLNKISGLVSRIVDYRRKFSSLPRLPSRSTILPFGTSFRP